MIEVESAQPSPFASALLFDYIATYMYEGDAPAAERRAQALQLDRALLAELLRADDLRELLDGERDRPGRAGAAGRGPRADASTRPTTCCAGSATCRRPRRTSRGIAAHIAELVSQRRAVAVRIAGEERFIAADDAGLYRDGLGVVPPPGLPAAFLEPAPDALRRLVLRYARTHGPFAADDLRARYGVDPGAELRAAGRRRRRDRGRLPARAAGGREWIAPDVLRRVRRRTLAAIRRAVEPVEADALAPVPARLAGRRPRRRPRPRPAARRGRPAPGGRAAGDGVGVRRAARCACPATGPTCWTSCAPAASSSGSAPARAGRRSTCAARPALLHTPGEPPDHPIVAGAARPRADVLRRPGRGRGRARPHGAGGALGAGLGRRRHERLLASPARRRGAARAAAAARRRAPGRAGAAGTADLVAPGRPRPLVARREPRRRPRRRRPSGRARWPRRCSTATACSPGPRCWPRASRAASRPSTASCG